MNKIHRLLIFFPFGANLKLIHATMHHNNHDFAHFLLYFFVDLKIE